MRIGGGVPVLASGRMPQHVYGSEVTGRRPPRPRSMGERCRGSGWVEWSSYGASCACSPLWVEGQRGMWAVALLIAAVGSSKVTHTSTLCSSTAEAKERGRVPSGRWIGSAVELRGAVRLIAAMCRGQRGMGVVALLIAAVVRGADLT
ncbi:hypothetical protein GUJ93_ZPchr0011g28778 [Zizania palustris]|uniref:Uncharacterized protein n=1 Tax=Zizania palustris TaxID=103762 RepID=A0A8J5WIV2_ZIZPA|nr:hypothetical protein GUJ93_ZPchr0011g28778 [Zizania palustris]